MADKAAAAMPRRQLVLLDPVLDYSALQPGAAAAAAVREDARALGLTPDRGVRVRVTGIVAVSDEEFASVAEGSAGTVLLSLGLLAGLLLLATRSIRLVVAILATIVAGLVVTAAFAAVAVRSLNMISVAFGVLFIGLAVDFAIQFTIRYRAERSRIDDLTEALRGAARGISGALLLAGTAAAVGFFAFLPTDYFPR
jgi:predicted RND superfamily exporter protein